MLEIKYDYDDILLCPAIVSEVESRNEVFIYDENGMLPIFTAPMLDVAGTPKSQAIFIQNRIYAIKPRKNDPTKGDLKSTSNSFVAVGMDDFIKYFCKGYTKEPEYVLIDIANGHQEQLIELVKKTKSVCYNTKIMVGNVANPKTYVELSNADADYIRVGIGVGCFVPEMEVMTETGLKKIVDINICDKVKTHTGEFEEVLQTHEYDKNEELITINDEITCTQQHEFYVIKKEDKEKVTEENIHEYAMWIQAKNLNDIYLLIEMD